MGKNVKINSNNILKLNDQVTITRKIMTLRVDSISELSRRIKEIIDFIMEL